MKTALRDYIIASSPATVVGVWNLGENLQRESVEAASRWQFALLEYLQIPLDEPLSPLLSLALGSAFFLPLLMAALATTRAWAEVFSRTRGRPVDPGWLLHAWLFALLLPATMPLHLAVFGLSFGAVFGCYVFGGTGRYIVNPALLGVAFISISYPDLLAPNNWLPGSDSISSWALVADGGIDAAVAADSSWSALFVGIEAGAMGTSSALACLLGATYLIVRKVASAGIVAAALIGLLFAGELVGDVPSHWHLATGSFAFGLAFIATDQTTTPRTAIGCWTYGALFGVLVVILRIADPGHPEATVSALLLATLCVPLLDYVARLAGPDAETPGVAGRG
ncbi:MAG TPA: RnfABCDGE type electron transport complex subunit D [Gammaproteobacteria bacterium]